MASYPKVRKGESLNFPAGLQNDLIDLLNANGGGVASGLVGLAAQGVVVMVKNTSGSDRARWDTMALSTTLRIALGSTGKESVVFSAIASDPAKPAAILQEPIANNKLGRALIFGYTLAKVAAGSASTFAAKANSSSKLAVDALGSVRLLAAASVSAETIVPVLVGVAAGGGGTGLAKSPVGGIPAQSGSTPGVASCSPAELYDDAGTIKIRVVSGADPILIYNTTSIASKSEKWIQWKTDGERKIIDVDDCNAGGGALTINGGTP
jgi:hypothetical protein